MRLFGVQVLRLAMVVAALVGGVALVAGAMRTLPLVLVPNVPAAVAPALGRGLFALAAEVGLFVAPPIAAAIVAARWVARGDVTALAALGVRPARLVLGAWPALVLGALGFAASVTWGRDASAPGRLVADLLRDARTACTASAAPAAIEVPLAGFAWICFPGEPPRAVARSPLGTSRAVLLAQGVEVSEDLRTLRAVDAALYVPGDEGDPERAALVLRADLATVRGLAPLGTASNLAPVARAALLVTTSLVVALIAAIAVIGRRIGSALRALAVGVAGPIAALLAFSSLERTPSPIAAYALLPIAGVAALLVVAIAVGRRRAG